MRECWLGKSFVFLVVPRSRRAKSGQCGGARTRHALSRRPANCRRWPLRCYEHAFLDAEDRRDRSVAEHEQVARLLETDLVGASEAIESHWRRGLATVLAAIAVN